MTGTFETVLCNDYQEY
uniref:Uncharacterized protein n=1 Tax=Rhizophora mucronata TaxID=61149 RepID=A0A2P2N1X5_RHIMU